MDDEQRYTAASSKDARFDGVFFTAVRTTGIYCRPSCPAITPKRANVVFYPTAAAAQQAGFRACKRCRPDASPGSPEWNIRSDVAGRAMRLIADGVVDRAGVDGLAARLGYSPRQVGRLLTAEVGAGPLALARAQRARTARILVETTALPMGDIAFAAGFSSIRQFNATMLEVYDIPPTVLRERAARGGVSVAATPAPGRPRAVRRRRRDRGAAAAAAVPAADRPGADVRLPRGARHSRRRGRLSRRVPTDDQPPERLRPALAAPRAKRELGGLLAGAFRPAGRDRGRAALPQAARPGRGPGGDLRFLRRRPGARAARREMPGRRSVGAVDGDEIAVRAVLGQQVSVAAARRLGGRLAALYGTPLPAWPCRSSVPAEWGLTHVFPDAATIAGLDPATLPMPLSRGRALVTLAAALAGGDIRLDRARTVRRSGPAGGAAGDRAVDRRIHPDAGVVGPGCVPSGRRRRAAGAAGARGRPGRARGRVPA